MNREQSEKLLAAYLMDELDASTRAEMDAAIAADANLRDRLADMRMALKLVHQGLEEEVKPSLSEARRIAILSEVAQPHGGTSMSWWRRSISLGVFRKKPRPHASRATPRWVRPLLRSTAAIAATLLLIAGIASLLSPSLSSHMDGARTEPQHEVASALQNPPQNIASSRNTGTTDHSCNVQISKHSRHAEIMSAAFARQFNPTRKCLWHCSDNAN